MKYPLFDTIEKIDRQLALHAHQLTHPAASTSMRTLLTIQGIVDALLDQRAVLTAQADVTSEHEAGPDWAELFDARDLAEVFDQDDESGGAGDRPGATGQ